MPANTPIQTIDELRKRHKDLERQKHTAEANCKTAEEQLQKLQDEARQQYGTDDIEKLKLQLEQMKKENDSKREDYQKHLDGIQTQLQEVEKQFAQ